MMSWYFSFWVSFKALSSPWKFLDDVMVFQFLSFVQGTVKPFFHRNPKWKPNKISMKHSSWQGQGSPLLHIIRYTVHRREIIVRGQSYFSRLPKFWPPIPLSARRVCTPRLCCGGRTDSPDGEGDGGSLNILEDERNSIALLQWSLYAVHYTVTVHISLPCSIPLWNE